MDDLIAWLRAQLDDDERVALEASRSSTSAGSHQTPRGEHWHWVEPEHDQAMTLDPMLDEYVNGGGEAALRSVEEYPTSLPYTLPHMVVSYAQQVGTIDAMHIARWDPARVLAEVDAKRRMLDWLDSADDKATDCDYFGVNPDEAVRLLALPYADRPGYRDEWRP